MRRRAWLQAGLLPWLLPVAGCGGGGGPTAGIGSGGTGIDPGGIGSGGTGVVATAGFGPVSGFGSIVVNGVRFEIDDARLLLEDVDLLRLGVTVQVDGSLAASGTDGVARTVRSAAELRGPVQSADAARGLFGVLGQQVLADAGTVYGGGLRGPTDVHAGGVVQVHGLPGPGGVLRATRIERAALAGVVLAGVATDLRVAGGGGSLRIGAQPVRWAAGALAAPLQAGQLVRVRAASAAGELQATRIEPWTAGVAVGTPPEGTQLTLAGLLVAGPAGTLQLQGWTLLLDRAQVSGGPSRAVVAGAAVEVRGTVAGTALRVDRVRLRDDEDGLAAPGGPAGAVAARYTATGPVGALRSAADFRVRGQDVDARAAVFAGGTAADLANGRQVLVEGDRVEDDVLVAARVTLLP